MLETLKYSLIFIDFLLLKPYFNIFSDLFVIQFQYCSSFSIDFHSNKKGFLPQKSSLKLVSILMLCFKYIWSQMLDNNSFHSKQINEKTEKYFFQCFSFKRELNLKFHQMMT